MHGPDTAHVHDGTFPHSDACEALPGSLRGWRCPARCREGAGPSPQSKVKPLPGSVRMLWCIDKGQVFSNMETRGDLQPFPRIPWTP